MKLDFERRMPAGLRWHIPLLIAAVALLAAPWTPAQDETPEASPVAEEAPRSADEEHEALFLETRFPAAPTSAPCHPGHYRDWSVSPHA